MKKVLLFLSFVVVTETFAQRFRCDGKGDDKNDFKLALNFEDATYPVLYDPEGLDHKLGLDPLRRNAATNYFDQTSQIFRVEYVVSPVKKLTYTVEIPGHALSAALFPVFVSKLTYQEGAQYYTYWQALCRPL